MNLPVRACVSIAVASLLLTGCGSSQQVTYVDPNGNAGLTPNAAGGSEPVAKHGVAAVERALATTEIRAALLTARTLEGTDRAAGSNALDGAISAALPLVEARTTASDPQLATMLRRGLETLRDSPPKGSRAYTKAVRQLIDVTIPDVEAATVSTAARQDPSFRATVLYETLNRAATSYETAVDGGLEEAEAAREYRRAYGLVVDAATRQLDALGDDAARAVRTSLDDVSRSSFPGPVLPDDPRDAETVLGELTTLADDVAARSGIDPTYPPPNTNAPDQLRSLKRAVAAAVEAVDRDAPDDALQQITAADRSVMATTASSIASVSPDLLAQLEQDLLVTLPDAIRNDGDVAAAAVQLDTRIDEAISLLEEELEQLRDSQ